MSVFDGILSVSTYSLISANYHMSMHLYNNVHTITAVQLNYKMNTAWYVTDWVSREYSKWEIIFTNSNSGMAVHISLIQIYDYT